ncbi:hypothetical protein [Mesorhizobium dulcispinae]|uniref:hypothetical protein n=1 Tax=Mesorhizobium dulcispinae TaxID=3072316 RepID=UPI002A24879C|nr:hypothetical protein [Mesorhizobium sp. VK23D]MDX8521310.1 hypothetical protein [Mesorhizobium sp. VK23D]
MVRRIKRRRSKRTEIPLVDADLLMRAGRDYFECLGDYGFDPAPRPGMIEDETMLAIWDDHCDELEAEWSNPRSQFYAWPEQGEPYIFEVLRRQREAA